MTARAIERRNTFDLTGFVKRGAEDCIIELIEVRERLKGKPGLAIRLKVGGHTHKEIALALGVDARQAGRLLDRGLALCGR